MKEKEAEVLTEAEATIRSSIISAFCDNTVQKTIKGLQADTSEPLVDALMREIFDPSVRWAVLGFCAELSRAQR